MKETTNKSKAEKTVVAKKPAAAKKTAASKAEGSKSAQKSGNYGKKGKKGKKSKGNTFLRIVIIILVIAVAWFFGGKPIVYVEDGHLAARQTEYPLVYTISDAVRSKVDSILGVSPAASSTTEADASEKSTSGTEKSEAAEDKTGDEAAAQAVNNAATSQKSESGAGAGSGVKAATGTAGSSAAADQGHSEDNPLFFGNPTDALFNTSSGTNYLMEKKQYTVSYNTDTLCPNWVAWHLDSDDIGEADRSDDFRPDTELPSGWYEITKADYQYNAYGFDRGHVCPSADRTASHDDNSMTFLMTNMVPQSPDNNRVIWMHFETYERQLVSEGNEVYIVAGPYGTGGTSSKGTFNEIPVTLKSGEVLHMNVPASTWKVCLVLPEGTNDASRITKDTTVIAINVPNKMGMGKTGDWEQFITSIDDIEGLTGYDFFELLPDDVEDALESKVYQYSK